jgi:hypothetical protein
MALVLFAVAACCYAARQVLLIRANPGENVPLWWGQPENSPAASRILTLLAVVLVVVGSYNLPDWIGLWFGLAVGAVLLSVALFLPSKIVDLLDALERRRRGDHDPRNADTKTR